MAPTAPFKQSTCVDQKIVPLNQDIAYELIKHIKGLDAVNFIEAANGSKQFQTVEVSEECARRTIFTTLLKEKKISVDVPYLDCYLETCFVDAGGYIRPTRYDHRDDPVLRLFIHPIFTAEAFEKLCCAYKTPLFQCYSRLLPFNTHSYVGNLVLVDYFAYRCSIGLARELNSHEQSVFKG